MFEITVKIEAPELVAAINHLANIQNRGIEPFNAPTRDENKPAPFPAGRMTNPEPVTAPVAPPAVQAPAPIPAPVALAPAPMTNPVPVAVPTAAPVYTQNQLAVAMTQLVDAGRRDEVLALIRSFGAPSLTNLAPEHYGALATKLRAMGAKI